MTSVLASPTSLTISAICDNGNTYAVGPTDGVIPGTATKVVWDIWKYQVEHPATPLAQAEYTLSVWGDRGKDALPRPGYLGAFGGLQFALYTPQMYTSIEDGAFSLFLRFLNCCIYIIFVFQVGSVLCVVVLG